MKNFLKILFLLLFAVQASAADWYISANSPFPDDNIEGTECRYLRIDNEYIANQYTSALNVGSIANGDFEYTFNDGVDTGATITLKACSDNTDTGNCTDFFGDIDGNGVSEIVTLDEDRSFIAATQIYLRAQVDVAVTGNSISRLKLCGSTSTIPLSEIDPIFRSMDTIEKLEAQIGADILLDGDVSITGHSDGANCPAGQYPLGVDENGAVQGCTVDAGNVFIPDADPGANHASYIAGHIDGINCPAGQYPLGMDGSGNAQGCTADTNTIFTPNINPLVDHSGYLAGHSDGANCPVGQYALGVDEFGVSQGCTLDSDTVFAPNADISVDYPSYIAGHSDGANCPSGSYPLGVDESGAVQGCSADLDTVFIPNVNPAINHLNYIAGHVNGSNCPAGQYPLGVDASGNVEGCTTDQTDGLGSTDLTMTRDATSVTIESSSGNNANIPAATVALAGILTAVEKANIDAALLKGGLSGNKFFTSDYVGNSTTDGFQEAVTAACGGLVPSTAEGTVYLDNSPVDIDAGGVTIPSTCDYLTVAGFGEGTIVNYISGNDGIFIDDTQRTTFRDFHMNQVGTASGGAAMHFDSASLTRIQNVRLSGKDGGGDGILGEFLQKVDISGSEIVEFDNGLRLVSDGSFGGSAIKIHGSVISYNDIYGILATELNGDIELYGTTMESNQTTISCQGPSGFLFYSGGYIENDPGDIAGIVQEASGCGMMLDSIRFSGSLPNPYKDIVIKSGSASRVTIRGYYNANGIDVQSSSVHPTFLFPINDADETNVESFIEYSDMNSMYEKNTDNNGSLTSNMIMRAADGAKFSYLGRHDFEEEFAIPGADTPPATCRKRDLFFDTDAVAGSQLLICEATDTWSVIAGGGSFTPNNDPNVDHSGFAAAAIAAVAGEHTPPDDIPESGDFGNAVDLEADGSLSTGTVGSNELVSSGITPGTYNSITFNSDGIATSGSIVADDDVPESGDFGGAVHLNADGSVSNGVIGVDQIAPTAVVAGSYTCADITTDTDGRLTAAADGTCSGGSGLLTDRGTHLETTEPLIVNGNGDDICDQGETCLLPKANVNDGDSITLYEGADDGTNTYELQVSDSGLDANYNCTIDAQGKIPANCLKIPFSETQAVSDASAHAGEDMCIPMRSNIVTITSVSAYTFSGTETAKWKWCGDPTCAVTSDIHAAITADTDAIDSIVITDSTNSVDEWLCVEFGTTLSDGVSASINGTYQ